MLSTKVLITLPGLAYAMFEAPKFNAGHFSMQEQLQVVYVFLIPYCTYNLCPLRTFTQVPE